MPGKEVGVGIFEDGSRCEEIAELVDCNTGSPSLLLVTLVGIGRAVINKQMNPLLWQ